MQNPAYNIIFKKSCIAAAILFAIGLVVAGFSLRATQQQRKSERINSQLSFALVQVSADLQPLDMLVKNYLDAGNGDEYDDFYKQLSVLRNDTATLKALMTASDSGNPEEWKKLQLAIFEKIQWSKQTVEVMPIYGGDSALQMYEAGKTNKLISDYQTAIILTKDKVQKTSERESSQRIFYTRIIIWIFLLLFITSVGCVYLAYWAFKKMSGIAKTKDNLLLFNASLIKNIYDPVITTNLVGIVTNWNKYAEKLYGYDESEVMGRALRDVLKTTSSTIVYDESEFPYNQEKLSTIEDTHLHKNGTVLYVEMNTSSIMNKEGFAQGFISVVRNITDSKKLQQQRETYSENLRKEVQHKTAELESVFYRVSDAFIALDSDFNYTYLNNKALEHHNKFATEIIGKNFLDIFPNAPQFKFYKALLQAKVDLLPVVICNYDAANERWFENSIYPSVDGFSVYYKDITESRNAQQAQHQSLNRLQSHIENTPLAVIETDKENKVITFNSKAAELFGLVSSAVVGHKVATLPAELKKCVQNATAQAAASHETINSIYQKFESAIHGAEVTHTCWHNSILKDEHGGIVGHMSLIEDITNRKKTEAELIEAEAKFRILVEETDIGVYFISKDKPIYLNHKIADILGYSEEELGKITDLKVIVHADDLELVRFNVARRFKKEITSLTYQFRGIKKSGEIINIEAHGSITLFKGEPCIIGSMSDITPTLESMRLLEKTHAVQRELTERFMLIAKASNAAIWDWDIPAGSVWGNHRFCDFFSIESEKDFNFWDFIGKVHFEDRSRVKNDLVEAFKAKKSLVEEEFRYEVQPGQFRIISDKAYIIYDENGRGVRMLGAFEDVTDRKLTKEILLKEKQLSDSIINSLPGIFYIINAHGEIKRWNNNFLTVTGYTAEEIGQMNILTLFAQKDWRYVSTRVRRLLKDGHGFIEIPLLDKSGISTQYYFTGREISYGGEPCAIGLGQDVSERYKVQSQLEESEAKYRTLVEQASDGIFITNAGGDFINVNTSVLYLTGYKENELLSMTMNDIFKSAGGTETFNIRDLNEGETFIYEGLAKQKSGTTIIVEISFKLLSNQRYQGIVRDISSRKKAQEALKISETKYRLLFDKNPLPLFIINTSTQKFMDVNAAAIEFYGFQKEEFTERTFFSLMHSNAVNVVKEDFESLINNLTTGRVFEQYTKEGIPVFVNIVSHDIMYEEQVAKLVVASDETKKILSEENLKKSHESLRQLAMHLEHIREEERTNMAREIHDELGQQLTGIKMDISMLQKKLKTEDETVQERVKDIKLLIDKTVITVRRLATELRPSILDDLGLVAAMEWQCEEFEKRSEIEAVFTSNMQVLTLDENIATNIFRIFQESLTNVSRHSEATQVVSVLNVDDYELKLEIKDNGKGFNTESIESKKTLGLLGMNERVLLLGGKYNIYSKPGNGTLIKVVVPLQVTSQTLKQEYDSNINS